MCEFATVVVFIAVGVADVVEVASSSSPAGCLTTVVALDGPTWPLCRLLLPLGLMSLLLMVEIVLGELTEIAW